MKAASRHPTLLLIGMAVAGWIFIGALVLISFWPWYPRTPTQWLAFLLLGVPIVVGFEYLTERLLSPTGGSTLSTRKFSWLRVLYALVVMLLLLGLLYGGLTLFGFFKE